MIIMRRKHIFINEAHKHYNGSYTKSHTIDLSNDFIKANGYKIPYGTRVKFLTDDKETYYGRIIAQGENGRIIVSISPNDYEELDAPKIFKVKQNWITPIEGNIDSMKTNMSSNNSRLSFIEKREEAQETLYNKIEELEELYDEVVDAAQECENDPEVIQASYSGDDPNDSESVEYFYKLVEKFENSLEQIKDYIKQLNTKNIGEFDEDDWLQTIKATFFSIGYNPRRTSTIRDVYDADFENEIIYDWWKDTKYGFYEDDTNSSNISNKRFPRRYKGEKSYSKGFKYIK